MIKQAKVLVIICVGLSLTMSTLLYADPTPPPHTLPLTISLHNNNSEPNKNTLTISVNDISSESTPLFISQHSNPSNPIEVGHQNRVSITPVTDSFIIYSSGTQPAISTLKLSINGVYENQTPVNISASIPFNNDVISTENLQFYTPSNYCQILTSATPNTIEIDCGGLANGIPNG